jgi:allantoicase
MPQDIDLAALERRLVDLALPRLGSEVVYATDEFFAPKERLIQPSAPVFIPDKYDAHGKWMDGWESRRRRDAGHDFCIVRLGKPGRIQAVDIDTRHFTGNYPPAASIEWCNTKEAVPGPNAAWQPLLIATKLNGNSHNPHLVSCPEIVTHLRLNIFPDGGVARLRVYGQVARSWSAEDGKVQVDLAAIENGGLPVACNDEHFGRLSNLIAPGKAKDMGDGWETRRRREPGHDWAIVKLGHPGIIESIVVDTSHFKGNYPDRCFIQAIGPSALPNEELITQSMYWPVILPEQKLSADSEHRFVNEIAPHKPAAFVRLNIVPDGGVARLRLLGRIAQ